MNEQNEIKFIDQHLVDKKDHTQILSILCLQDGFLFYKHLPNDNFLIHFEKQNFPPLELYNDYIKITKSFVQDLVQQDQYSKIRFVWPSPKVTLIPSAIFDSNKIKDLYYFNFEKIRSESDILSYYVDAFKSHLIFPVPIWLSELKNELNQKVEFYNQTISFVNFIALQDFENEEEMFVNIMAQHIDIAVMKNKQLIFFNSFQFNSETDFIYHVLNVITQLGLRKKDLVINLFGVTSKSDEKLKLLPQFIEQVYFYKELKLKFNITIDQELIIEHLNFLNLHLCES